MSDERRQIKAWRDTADHYARNAYYYRSLLVQIGKLFGEAAYISDDGSRQADVLVAKVPELVEQLVQADTITVWKDGTHKRWSRAAAAQAENDPEWLATIPVAGKSPECCGTSCCTPLPQTMTVTIGGTLESPPCQLMPRARIDALAVFSGHITAVAPLPSGTEWAIGDIIEDAKGRWWVIGAIADGQGTFYPTGVTMPTLAASVQHTPQDCPNCEHATCGDDCCDHEAPTDPPACSCPIAVLMSAGCQCGAVRKDGQ